MEFIGNKKAVKFIQRVLKGKSFSQAYLFSGPENLGKFLLANSFALSIIEDREDLLFQEKIYNSLDLITLIPEVEEKKGKKKEKDIPIEKIREVKRKMSLFPSNSKMKVLIINNAHRMTVSSQNALLKMLEEPNSTSVIILVSHEDSKILPTIKSRCQKLVFSLVGKSEMLFAMKNEDAEKKEKYETVSMGRPGIMMELLEDNDKFLIYEKYYKDIEAIMTKDINKNLLYAEKMSKDSLESQKILNVWVWILRKKYFENNSKNADEYYSKIEMIEKASFQIKNSNANLRLILENLLISI